MFEDIYEEEKYQKIEKLNMAFQYVMSDFKFEIENEDGDSFEFVIPFPKRSGFNLTAIAEEQRVQILNDNDNEFRVFVVV